MVTTNRVTNNISIGKTLDEKQLTTSETQVRWLRAINERLTNDKVTATKIIRTDSFMKLVGRTWEPALRKEKDISVNWITCGEVLVGRTA